MGYNASASLNFTGTGVQIYGAKRSNHGLYHVTLDGVPHPCDGGLQQYQCDGFYDGEISQQVLFSATGLDANKLHTVSIINLGTAGRPYLDVDSVRGLSLEGDLGLSWELKCRVVAWGWR